MRPIDLERRQQCLAELRRRYPQQHADDVIAVLDGNPSADLPYHGTGHIVVVALAALELAAGEDLSRDETTLVFLAALFHDYDYAGDADDTVNVARSAAAARRHLTFTDSSAVARLIESTRFPYLSAPASRTEEVLRDADVAWSTLLIPDAQHFRTGLYLERGAPATEQDAIAFIIGHGLQTRTAAAKVDSQIRRRPTGS